jgi:TonB-dependent SusC/RagA subfamily outer membrane receptor
MTTFRYTMVFVGSFIAATGCASSRPQSTNAGDTRTLTAAELSKHGDEPIEMMLQRRFPGIAVIRNADGDVTLQIRGATSTNGMPNEPLYVINGMEVDPRGQGLQSLVNPYEIESISVLRGADAAIYGVRGGDGVIVIKTKSASSKR